MRVIYGVTFCAMLVCLPGLDVLLAQNTEYDNTMGLQRPPGVRYMEPLVVTTPDGFDNFDIGVDFAEVSMASHPSNPLWYFNAFNSTSSSLGSIPHYSINGLDWATVNPTWGATMWGDPVAAYDSIGNLYFENMYGTGASILGCKVARSTNNGQSWVSVTTAIAGVDKNWIACDQTSGPFANYVYTTMTATGGNFARSTDFGATWQTTNTFPTQTLPGMMVAVGPDVSGSNNIPGGCVYVVTNSGSAFASTYTFYRSTDGGLTFSQMSSQNFSNYVGTNVSGRNSVENMRTRPYPFIAADNSYGPYRGRLYLVYSSNYPAGDGFKPDIWLRYSTNQGVTWSEAIRINDDESPEDNHQWMPAIWVDKQTGRFYCKWWDTRNCVVNDDSTDVYASFSDDGGVTWAPNQRITNRMFKINCTTCGGGGTPRYQGDYDAITSNEYTGLASWMDFRNGNFGSYVAYFPDFAMKTGAITGSFYSTDSAVVKLTVPAVKLYDQSVRFSATVSPAANFSFTFPDGDSLTAYPDSLDMRISAYGVAGGNYTVTVIGKGPNGTPVHRRTIPITVTPITITGTNNYSVGQFLSLPSRYLADSTYAIRARVFNLGTAAQTDVPVRFFVNGSQVGNDTLLSLASSAYANVAFDWTPATAGDFALEIQSFLANDTVPGNDSVRTTVHVADSEVQLLGFISPPTNGIVGVPIPVSARVKNNGNPQVHVPVLLFDNGVQVGVDSVDLTLDGQDTARFVWTPTAGGARILKAQSFAPGDTTFGNDSVRTTVNIIDGDVAVTGFVGLVDTITIGQPRVIKARIANNGKPQPGVIVRLFENSVEVDVDTVALVLGGLDTAMFDWTPSTSGQRSLKAKTYLPDDMNPANDSAMASMMVYPEGLITYTYSSGSVNLAIPDNNATGVTSTIDVPDSIEVYDVNVRIDTVMHPFDGNLSFTLLARSGSVNLDLSSGNGGSGDNFIGTIFDDEATVAITGGAPPYTGKFRPEQSNPGLKQYRITEGFGSWSLKVADNVSSNTGTLNRWSIILTGLLHNPPIGISDVNGVPRQFALSQNYPNPFNPVTTIAYSVANRTEVSLTVYNILGQEVRTLVDQEMKDAGYYRIGWDGKNDAGVQVSSGIYLYRMQAGSFIKTRKMLLVK